MDFAFVTNPRTGRLDMQTSGGSPVRDDSRFHKVMSRLVAHRALWWADKSGTYGSRLRDVKNLRRTTPSDLEAFAREALAPLVTAGEILPPRGERQVLATIEKFKRTEGRAVVVVRWATPSGEEPPPARYPLRF